MTEILCVHKWPEWFLPLDLDGNKPFRICRRCLEVQYIDQLEPEVVVGKLR
jgi:hypothetical protein